MMPAFITRQADQTTTARPKAARDISQFQPEPRSANPTENSTPQTDRLDLSFSQNTPKTVTPRGDT
jgi:hypothetical protein